MHAPHATAPSLRELARMAESAELGDRAFAASVLALQTRAGHTGEVVAIYERIREVASLAHRQLRAQIADQSLPRAAFLEQLRALPLELRDHFVEEVLGIAYPPLVPRPLPRELVGYSPSGIAEISFMLEHAKLGPQQRLVDLGSGLGKVTLLAALLTGASAIGIELDRELVAGARAAAEMLRLDGVRFIEGDLRDVPLPEADVYYAFIPLQRSRELVRRLGPIAERRPIAVFAQGLDLSEAPWLRRSGAASYWLEHYESVAPRCSEDAQQAEPT